MHGECFLFHVFIMKEETVCYQQALECFYRKLQCHVHLLVDLWTGCTAVNGMIATLTI